MKKHEIDNMTEEEFQAWLAYQMNPDLELESEAVALIKQYGLFLPAPAKAFFRKLAIHLKWDRLTSQLGK